MTTDKLNILFEDSDLIVVNKLSGLLSVPGKGPDKQDCLISRALTSHPNSRVVHRLDMGTSGIVLLPQNHFTQSHLAKQFQERSIKKQYTAIVQGALENKEGEVDLPLICDWPNRPKQMVCHSTGKQALTHYRVEKEDSRNSRVTLFPVTGRSHQLRVHMLALGHPILGDELYATGEALAAANRLLLHAEKISFLHPRSNEIITIECPPDF